MKFSYLSSSERITDIAQDPREFLPKLGGINVY